MPDLQLFAAMYDSIVEIFEFWTVVWTNWTIQRCHFGLVFISCSLSLKQRLEEMWCTVKYAVPFSPLNKNSMKEVCSVVLVRKGKKKTPVNSSDVLYGTNSLYLSPFRPA